jgi:hypothetical protein
VPRLVGKGRALEQGDGERRVPQGLQGPVVKARARL